MNKFSPDPRNAQAGFGMVEILVSLALGLLLSAGLVQVYLGSKESYNAAEELSRRQENARFAMKTLSRELQPAGYLGCLGVAADRFVNTLELPTDPDAKIHAALEGVEGGAAADSVAMHRASGGGSIAVTQPMASQTAPIQLDPDDPGYADLEKYDILTISDCHAAAVFMITKDPGADGIIQHAVGVTAPSGHPNEGESNKTEDLEHIFGAKTSASARVYKADPAPTDYSVKTVDGHLWLVKDGEELAKGTHDMQIEYGLPAGGGMQYVPAGSTGLEPGGARWGEVESMRVTLGLVDGANPTDGTGPVGEYVSRTFRVRNRNP